MELTEYKDGQIWFNDTLEQLRTFEDNSIDHIITDPPYNIDFAEWDKFFNVEEITAEWSRILKPGGSIFCFTGWSFVTELITKFNSDFKLNDWIIYDRIKGRGAKKRLVSTREDLLWYVNSDKWTFNKDLAYSTIVKKTKGMGSKNGRDTRALSNVWTDISPLVPWSKERNGYPTQKPLSLMTRILKTFTNENDIILDPFAGSGTTGEACIINKRKFIMIDNNPEAIKLQKERISKHYLI